MTTTTTTTPHPLSTDLALHKIVGYALKNRASDIHLKVGRPPAVRIDSVLRFVPTEDLSEEQFLGFLHEIMDEQRIVEFLETGDADMAVSFPGQGRFRANIYRQRGAMAMILRHVRTEIPDFKQLNLPEKAMEKIANLPRGLVLVTGTTSSGKSTTLAAIIGRINQIRHGHIVTLEDPIEYVHHDNQCSVSQREVGIDTKDFRSGLRAIMREDPNVILIGEMRDVDTFYTCLGAAETGHLVFSTLHTTNVMMTIDRILDMFPSSQQAQIRSQLALQLKAVVSQRLLPNASGSGRVPAVEIMFATPGIISLIREDEIGRIPQVIADGSEEGMQTFNMHLIQMVKAGTISMEDAEFASDNADALKANLSGIFGSRDRGGITKHRPVRFEQAHPYG
ncbi:MAG: PilT/PilU family type 4a pilus ATPase [Candidatus Hydrogenedentes bacterium]|nr:PilT/PilU family type 4a pilus ATPase [Candidatus Hydrogenedentota bacterium]